MSHVTTHVLDAALGLPAPGIAVALSDPNGTVIALGETDADGRATAILQGDFHSGDIIAVTVEPAGGSPDGTPSSAPVIAVATA